MPRFNDEQIEKLKQENRALISRAEAVGIDATPYLQDNVVMTPSERVEREKVM